MRFEGWSSQWTFLLMVALGLQGSPGRSAEVEDWQAAPPLVRSGNTSTWPLYSAYAPAGKTLVVLDTDKQRLLVYDLGDLKALRDGSLRPRPVLVEESAEFMKYRTLSVAADGKALRVGDTTWRMQGKRLVQDRKTVPGVDDLKASIARFRREGMSANGDYLGVASGTDLVLYEPEVQGQTKVGFTKLEVLKGQDCRITSVALGPDGKAVAGGDEKGNVRLWRNAGVEYRGTNLATPKGVQLDEISALQFNPDGSLLAAGDKSGQVVLWDVAKAEVFASFDSGHFIRGQAEQTLGVLAVDFSPDGQFLGTLGNDQKKNQIVPKLWKVEKEPKPICIKPIDEDLEGFPPQRLHILDRNILVIGCRGSVRIVAASSFPDDK